MQAIRVCAVLSLLVSHQIFAQEPLTNALPGRTLIKLAPDYLRPVVYALNAPGQGNPGTLLALNATNGVVLNEIVVETGPTVFYHPVRGCSLRH